MENNFISAADSGFDEEPSYLPPDYMRQAAKKRRSERRRLTLGIIIIIFALIGLFSLIFGCVSVIQKSRDKKEAEKKEYYASLLLPVTAVSPSGFDDVTTADMDTLVEISVWSIIGAGLNPEDYEYSSDELKIPLAEVEAAYTKYFGSQRAIEHRTVDGYGYEFRYSAEESCYYIPLTTITPLYIPQIEEIKESGGTVVIRCGMVNPDATDVDYTGGGSEIEPEPDKIMTVTLRTLSGALFIGSISY